MIDNNEMIEVTEDDEPFLIQQGLINTQLELVRKAMLVPNPNDECVDCEEPIGEARKKAVPSALRCIDCETLFAKR